ncbi:MAG: PIG-L family deacetylase [Planctomycetes bacterium]|nr:PIG-L family deacetylase [Planctomycetota bacterium]
MRVSTFLWTSGVLTVAVAPVLAQQPEPEAGLVALEQARLDADNPGVVLNVAAHPDDESSRTNTMLRRKFGLRVVTVYSTYGDGGQNAIGREIGPELAWLRVRETLRAAAMSDVDVRWLGMPDFGFSKNLEETLRVWDGDRLRAAMRAILDEIEPDIIITNHNPTQGHGHHRASYWAVSEVLKERATAGGRVPPLYARCGVDDAHFTLDPSELDPARGETFARLAHRAWTQHITQGPWGPHNPLQVGKDHWRLVFPEGVAKEQAADPRRWLPAEQLNGGIGPSGVAPPSESPLSREDLAAWHAPQPAGVAAAQRWSRKRQALQRIAMAHAGVRVETWLDRDEVARDGTGKVFVVVHGHGKVKDLKVGRRGTSADPAMATLRATPFDGLPAPPAGATGAAAAAPAQPAAPVALPGRFVVPFTHDRATEARWPEPSWVDFEVEFTLGDLSIRLQPRLPYTPVDPVELRWDRDVVMVPKGQTVERILSASIASHRDGEVGEPIRLAMGPGIKAEAIPGRVSLSRDHPEARLLLRATFTVDELAADSGLRLEVAGQQASLKIVPVEVFVPPGLRVGLVRGPDDTTERALADLGVAMQVLDRDALATARLDQFTTLLLDIRAYHHMPELAEHRDRILQFCRAGGRIVAMYHKPGEWNERAGHPLLAPFALTVGEGRITEEDAVVTMLSPEHRLWRAPHAITPADFAGWVQERGLNFASKWDPAWTPLLQMQDRADDKPQDGALLYTQYGRGDFVHCSLALYRQLRVGNAGAARLLINLLAR